MFTLSPVFDLDDFLDSHRELMVVCDSRLKYNNEKSPTDISYSIGTEGFISNTIQTICEFLKKLAINVKQFVSKLFNMIFDVTKTNETNLNKLKDVFRKREGELNSIEANPNIPSLHQVEKVFSFVRDLSQVLISFDLLTLQSYVALAADGKVTNDKFDMNFRSMLGENYLTLFNSVGLTVESDNSVSFKSVFVPAESYKTIGELGYDYDKLKSVHQILSRHIDPLKRRLDGIVTTLNRITDSILKLKSRVDDGNSEQYKYILEILPKEISSVISLYQKTGFMILTYEMKFSEILKNLYSDLK